MPTDTLAHDVNNLLMIVAGCCERLGAQRGLTPEQRSDLERISLATRHAGRLTAQMMGARRDDPPAPVSTNLTRAIHDTARLLEHALGDRIAIDLQLALQAVAVPASDGDIVQVLTNLALNARQAMPDGGTLVIASRLVDLDAATAAASQLAPGRYAELSVRDNGTGMSEATRAQVFERFFTARPDGGGTGLGLPSVKRVVERWGGTIHLESQPGRGTRVTLLVPLVDEARTEPPPSHAADPRGTETIVVADDDPDVRDIITEALRARGYHVLEAGTAEEAARLATERPVHLLVADLDLPDATGLELAGRVAADAPDARVLIVSGYNDTRSDGALEASGFLQKPFTQAALAEKVRAVLDGPRARMTTPARTAENGHARTAPAASPPVEALLDTLPAPVFVVQRQQFTYVNAAFAELFGLAPHDLIGHDSLERVHPDDRAIAPRQPPVPGTPLAPRAVTQLRVRRPDGAERSLAVTTVFMTYDGTPALLGTASDITLQPDAINISVRMAALGRLAGGIAHDFNNLLLVVGGQIERLQGLGAVEGELGRSLATMAAAAERAAMLTDQLLSFGRRQMLTPQVMDLKAFLLEMEPQLRDRVGPGVDLVVRCEGDLPSIRADRPRLREVLWHLADNARDAMTGGGSLTIAVDRVTIGADLKARWSFLALGGEFVRLRVIDTGAGMNPEVMPHVFEPFFTTKGRGRGGGMGLASVYGIVKQSAGYVFVERTGADGTCITILLPTAAARDAAAHDTSALPVHQPVGRRPRILLVEDDMAVRELLEDVLTAHGFEVMVAETAEQAELQADDWPFDLLLSDIDLPGMSGARLAAALARRRPDLRIILMSGYPDDGEIAEARLEDRAILMKKPFSTTVLVDRIRHVLAPET